MLPGCWEVVRPMLSGPQPGRICGSDGHRGLEHTGTAWFGNALGIHSFP